jgi:hypothetical protein
VPERIGEAALLVRSPRGLVADEGLNVGGAGLGCLLDELAGVIDEDLDSRGGQSRLDRAWLGSPSRYGLVEHEGRTAQVQPGYAAEVPQFGDA